MFFFSSLLLINQSTYFTCRSAQHIVEVWEQALQLLPKPLLVTEKIILSFALLTFSPMQGTVRNIKHVHYGPCQVKSISFLQPNITNFKKCQKWLYNLYSIWHPLSLNPQFDSKILRLWYLQCNAKGVFLHFTFWLNCYHSPRMMAKTGKVRLWWQKNTNGFLLFQKDLHDETRWPDMSFVLQLKSLSNINDLCWRCCWCTYRITGTAPNSVHKNIDAIP